MVDHHVDRPGVEASQDVELTGTNRSEILINLRTARRDAGSSSLYSFNKFPGAIGSSSGSPSRRGSSLGPKRLAGAWENPQGFWRPWRRGPTRSHTEHGS